MNFSIVVYSWSLIDWIYIICGTWCGLFASSLIVWSEASSYLQYYVSDVSYWLLFQLPLGHWFIPCCWYSFYMKYLIRIGPYHLVFIFNFVVLSLVFYFRDPAHAERTDLDIDGSIISHISSAWSRDPNISSFQYWSSWTLRSANMNRTSIEDVWPRLPCLSWSPLFPPFMEVCRA